MSERRSVARTRVRRNAEILVSHGSGSAATKMQCTLQDLTSSGACLSLATTERMPDTFELTFDGGRSRRPCRVMWRAGNQLGISFEKPRA
jgi:PilZ domain-containing protein